MFPFRMLIPEQAKLETKLASLYKTLIGFHNLIEDSEKPSLHPVSQHINKAMQDRMTTRLLKSCAMIKDCCGDLVQLSFGDEIGDWQPEGYENDFAEDVFFSQA
jgi:hypothetical protein